MRLRVYLFVYGVVAAALAASAVVYMRSPLDARQMLVDAVILCVLAIAGELLGYMLPHRAMGSIGFIPYFAAAVLVPAWPSILAVALLRTGLEVFSPREGVKRLLNIGSHTLMEATVVLVYTSLGGTSLLNVANRTSLAAVTHVYGFPAIAAFNVAFFSNNLIVCAVIALASNRSILGVCVDNLRSTVGMDLITAPVVFVFAWVYAAFGAPAAVALYVPILGLRQVHRVNLELERTNEELLELMVKSIEARDPYTSGHSRRVHHYSTIIARAIGLRERQIAEIGRAALLHDIGKIYEKYAPVIAKQDKLTPEEWAIIQDHPVDGANLVATMSRLRDVVPAVRSHHENWDGTGYPDGIAGEVIPLAARIIRFADTIDAMTTERPYRRPLSEAAVRAEVVKCRGTQFDPMIADRLLSSALWSTLFAPAVSDRRTTPFALVGSVKRRTSRLTPAKLVSGA